MRGIVNALLRSRRIFSCWKLNTFIAETIGAETAEELFTPKSLEFRELTPEDVWSEDLFAAAGRRPAFADRLQQGHRCFGFFLSGVLISYLWVSSLRFTHCLPPLGNGAYLSLPSGSSYIWDCHTLSEYRGRGLYRKGLARLRCVAAPDKWVLIAADPSNVSACKAISNAGFIGSTNYTLRRVGPIFILRNREHKSFFLSPELHLFKL